MASAAWRPDILGPGFEQLTLPLGSDSEGEVVATLVRYKPGPDFGLHDRPARRTDVLYVHGWSDYFFQTELARYWHRMGADFYAIDLRKYGRSLREGQTPGFVDNLATYDEDLEAALRVIGHGEADHPSRSLILMGHSTGGLTLSLWADRHPGRAAALVLNSPWLEFQARGFGREVFSPLIGIGARVDPLRVLPNVDLGYYTRSVLKAKGGDWDYNLEWRPERGFPVRPAWLNAVLAGHARVALGLSIDAAVFTMVSARSTIAPVWSEAMRSSDIVLNVDDIAMRALKLAPTVTIARIEGALHDILLSRADVRRDAYARLTRFVRGLER